MATKTPAQNPFEQLRRAREASGDTVESLATRAGVDPAWLAGVESGADPGDEHALGLLGNALSINLDDLFGRARRTTRRRTTTARPSARTSSGSMDGAVRAAVRAEIAPVEGLLRDLLEEIARLRRAQADADATLARIASAAGLAASGKTPKAAAPRKGAKKAARR